MASLVKLLVRDGKMTKQSWCETHSKLWDKRQTQYMKMLELEGYAKCTRFSPKEWVATEKTKELTQ